MTLTGLQYGFHETGAADVCLADGTGACACRLNMEVTLRAMTLRAGSAQWPLRTSSPNMTSELCHLHT